jgi:hypothetical protein
MNASCIAVRRGRVVRRGQIVRPPTGFPSRTQLRQLPSDIAVEVLLRRALFPSEAGAADKPRNWRAEVAAASRRAKGARASHRSGPNTKSRPRPSRPRAAGSPTTPRKPHQHRSARVDRAEASAVSQTSHAANPSRVLRPPVKAFRSPAKLSKKKLEKIERDFLNDPILGHATRLACAPNATRARANRRKSGGEA